MGGITVDNKNTELFDLAILMRQGDLNIRRAAAAARDMTAGEYFDKLSELLSNAPKYSHDLQMLVSRDGDRSIYKELADMFTLVISLGYEKHTTDFNGMLDAYDRGNSRITSAYAKKLKDDFGGFCLRIAAARVTQLPEAMGADPYETPLKEWIDGLFKENTESKPVIFAVDDSPVLLKSLASLLGEDYKVYTLAKSVLVEKMLSQIKPELFLLDYNMPIINGLELIPIIRGFAEHKDTPIIFLTSEGTIDNVSGAMLLGACDFIVKPVHPGLLQERIARHIVKDRKMQNVS